MQVFERYESEVRSYIRSFPTVFERARGCLLVDRDGREYLDFFAGAGVLNYGHNHPAMKRALIDYVEADGIAHSLDMATTSKERFLERFHDVILEPRGMGDFRVQFPGPTGTNAVEAALKLARKVTGRELVMSFTNAFHGMTLGALAVTGSTFKRAGAGIPLAHASSMPYDGYFGPDVDTIDHIERLLGDQSSGIDVPAAIIVETVQGEGGINVAGFEWLQRLEDLARRWDVLFIVDDIQVGNGRTGPFFSFERAGLHPDIVTLSKSLSGFGQPLSVTLFRDELDVWDPGEHNGTFRGNNLAFVTGAVAIDEFWQDDRLTRHVDELADVVGESLTKLAANHPAVTAGVRGRGLVHGIELTEADLATRVTAAAFERGLVLETSGPTGSVVKLLPPLVIERHDLEAGLEILHAAVAASRVS
ncbi:diaminobutyrate--2-oxoglutarate transaminase [Acidimicrobiia bacterium EGI L10123]|uniref:diaminobutyrate--2-oxoglutarate transaminase n=1 Tax=Salinilacustrithrix flava TaxID=2957203 RepID=UPI003D7C2A82|nr:diaminobutyrate--2-oxoglutarate transaminase [Acidimicrobiia bacterium EGI L10123]